jgi:hypothetical protein
VSGSSSSGAAPVTGSSSGGSPVTSSGSSSGGVGPGTGSSSSGAGATGSDAGTGGGSGGAGTATATGGGDAGQGGASLCAQAKLPPISAVICDGFETTPSAFTASPAGSMTSDTTQFYRGKTSMKFSSSSMAYLTETSSFTGTTKATNNNFWGRYFFLSDVATAAAVPQSHAVFGTMHGTDTSSANADDFHFVGGSRGKLQSQIQFAADVFSDNEKTPAATDPAFPIMSDGWQCWEWQLTADDSYHFYINGAEVTEMAINAGMGMGGKSFSPLPTVTELEIGWQYFGTGLFAGWIDEVAVGPNRIGCGN